MKTIRPGHTYELDWFEHPGRHEKLQFIEAVKQIRDLWLQKPVANDSDWHAAVLALVQALDRKADRKARGVEGKHLQ